MKRLTVTLCLTITLLLGSVGCRAPHITNSSGGITILQVHPKKTNNRGLLSDTSKKEKEIAAVQKFLKDTENYKLSIDGIHGPALEEKAAEEKKRQELVKKAAEEKKLQELERNAAEEKKRQELARSAAEKENERLRKEIARLKKQKQSQPKQVAKKSPLKKVP